MHPHDSKDYTDSMEQDFIKLCENENVRAYGEIGLDYHYDNSPRDVQREVFIRQLEVAEKLCDKVAIIKQGRLIASGTMDEVRGDQSLEEVFLELEGDGNA